MKITVTVGDVLTAQADALISTANPWLNMSGGVNGAILASAGGETIQAELKAYLQKLGRASVPPGTVVVTSAGPLEYEKIIHAVAIDPFYDSSVDLVATTLKAALKASFELGAQM